MFDDGGSGPLVSAYLSLAQVWSRSICLLPCLCFSLKKGALGAAGVAGKTNKTLEKEGIYY